MVGSQLCSQSPDNVTLLRLLPSPLKSAKRTIVILSLALAGCRTPAAVPNQTVEVTTLRLLTDSSTHALLVDLAAAYHPPGMLVAWSIQRGEARVVLDWLSNGEIPYALINYVPELFAGKTLWSTPVGYTGIAVIVNQSNLISNLTALQLRSILQGRTTNWQELGGNNTPITVVAQSDASSDTAIVQSIVLGNRQITRAARLATTPESVINIVAADPGAIGYVPMAYLSAAVKSVALENVVLTSTNVLNGTYPLSAPLVFVGLKEPGNDAYRAFFAWVQSPEGQAVVQQHYVPLGKQ